MKPHLGDDSYVEAHVYLSYRRDGIRFLHDRKYPDGLGNHRYDFYLVDEDKYVEVTGYNKYWSQWKNYLAKIDRKRQFVQQRGSQFEFIRIFLSPEQIDVVKSNIAS